MSLDSIINDSINDLSKSSTFYLMFKDLTAFKKLDENSDHYRKLKYEIVRCGMFEKHTDHAIRFSILGLKVVNEFGGDFIKYKKSLKPKKDYFKIISAFTGLLSLLLVYMNFSINNKAQLLEERVEQNKVTIDSLETKIDSQAEMINSKTQL